MVKTFKAVVEPLDDGLGWLVAWLPFDIATAWPKMVRLRVVIEVGGEEFRSSLFAAKHGVVPEHRRKEGSTGEIPRKNAVRGGHFFVVNMKMQAAAGVGAGGVAEFRVWADLEERKAPVAEELAAILKRERALDKWYKTKLNDSARWAINKWIEEVKPGEPRVRRADQIAERMMETMEAELELPPMIANALRGRAMEGWKKMTEARRRDVLMAVFSYRSVESRRKRIGKLVEECVGKIV